ncbi:glycoside hydrolase family 99-like domain-containing protein [Paenibacillus larvae]
MKIISFYLPQFHQIPENDLWWGEGFTEWSNTRKAKSLYPNHYQPREPIEDYYYNLTDPSTRTWQARLASQYGVYGFCYYHYWFKGKRLLERPFKEVLKSGEPDFPFCLSWANESWTRRWDGGKDHILIRQDYGNEQDWEEHFYELLPAFQDKRYIRIDGKPVFIIYRSENIPCWEQMALYWRQLAVKNQLKGIFFIQTLGGFPIPSSSPIIFEARLEFEPHYTLSHGSLNAMWPQMKVGGEQHLSFDYDYVWNSILSRSLYRDNIKVFPGAFVDWDNSPRLGNRGLSCIGANPRKFGWYLSEQIRRAKYLYKSEFLFINAWNEWAEGAYLEPDKKYGYRYLESLKYALDLSVATS